MATHVYDDASFRAQFPEFASSIIYPANTLLGYFGVASDYINPNDGYINNGATLQLMLDLMTAHLAKSFSMINAGQTSVILSGSSTGSVSVSLTPPPVKNAYQWWLSTTPYGNQLRALQMAKAAGGFMAGGSLERSAFRKAGGVF
jgi:hypothetical protein